MSTLPAIQVEETSAWKQEVSRRLAAHKSHKAAAPAQRQAAEPRADKRAADAAARVAARFAKAPSYSQMLAEEARAAVRAAEAASQAALHAQAAAESVLASLEADLGSPYEVRHEAAETLLFPAAAQAATAMVETATAVAEPRVEPAETVNYSVQWDRELPASRVEPAAQAVRNDGWDEGWQQENRAALEAESIQIVEAAQPIHANLIEFPRELVATRKARPRLAEGPLATATEPGGQLSIFEVDPGVISTEPAAAESMAVTVEPVWTGPEWSGIELDEQPVEELAEEPEARAAAVPAIELAQMSRRLLATVVDGSLIGGAFLAAAAMAMTNAKLLPAPRVAGAVAAMALVAIAALYKVLFSALATATPGMHYAGIRLATFSGAAPTRAQRCGRLAALLVSVLPVGLGVMWSIFDDEHLSWHDRLSRTYLRRG